MEFLFPGPRQLFHPHGTILHGMAVFYNAIGAPSAGWLSPAPCRRAGDHGALAEVVRRLPELGAEPSAAMAGQARVRVDRQTISSKNSSNILTT